MKKRFLSLGLATVMLGAALPCLSVAETAVYAGDEAKTFEQLTYEIVDGHVEITGCDKNAEEVVIPAEIEGMPVTQIRKKAFSGCKALTSVILP